MHNWAAVLPPVQYSKHNFPFSHSVKVFGTMSLSKNNVLLSHFPGNQLKFKRLSVDQKICKHGDWNKIININVLELEPELYKSKFYIHAFGLQFCLTFFVQENYMMRDCLLIKAWLEVFCSVFLSFYSDYRMVFHGSIWKTRTDHLL